MAARIVASNVVIPGLHKAFPVQQRNICSWHVRSMDTLQAYAFQSRRKLHTKSQLRRWRTVNLKWMKTLIAMIVLYCMRAKINMSTAQQRVPKKTHLIANLPYRLKQYQTHHKYLRVQLDTCADVNIMPKSVYQMFNDPEVQQLAPNDISLGVYTDHQVDILGKCIFHDPSRYEEATCSDILCCQQ